MRTGFILSTFVALTLAFTSCRTAQKYVESGNYDGAIDFCIKHLRGEKKKNEDYVKGLELAYAKAQERDLNRLEQLRSQNTIDSWNRAFELALDIRERQDKVEPLVPLRAKSGYMAHFSFVDAEGFVVEAKDRASQLLYQEAERLLADAKNGNRSAARAAYDKLETLGNKYNKNYRDCQHLMSTALSLGATRTVFSVSNRAHTIMPAQFEAELMSFTSSDLNSRWKKFDLSQKVDLSYHYRASFVLDIVEISPEFVRENRYWDEKTVKDGFEYVLDGRGNVMKDTLGNDIKRLKSAVVRAEVLEVNQRKTARVEGYLEVYDATGRQLLERKPIRTEVVFDHLSVTWRGDERALSDKTKCNLGSVPKPFPSDYELLGIASEQLRPMVGDALRGSSVIY
jgi:hypothetical protein